MACKHCPSAWDKSKDDLIKKSFGDCHECKSSGPNLWACLQNSCKFVGCSESAKDHSSNHFEVANHAVAVNLQSFRTWCYVCKMEVVLSHLFSATDMKLLRRSKIKKVPGTAHKKEIRQGPPSNESLLSMPQIISPVRCASLLSVWLSMYRGFEEEPTRGLTGLRNLGNTCYMNSALQSLSNCPQLSLHFMALGKFQNFEKKNTMSRSYYKLISDIWSGSNYASVSPSAVNSTVKMINPAFRGHQQQDTQEFLRCLMDRMHEEMKYSLPVHEVTVVTQEAGDANSLTSHSPPQASVLSSGLIVEDAISMATNSSSGESYQSCESAQHSDMEDHANGDETDAMLVNNDDLSTISMKDFSQLHSSGFPLYRSNSLPSISTSSSKSDHADGKDEILRKRTISSRSTTQIETMDGATEVTKPKSETKFEFRSVISDIFDGALRSSVQCRTCSSLSHTRETFQDLSLPIPGKDDTARLHGLSPVTLPASPSPSSGPCAHAEGYTYGGLYGLWEWMKSFTNWLWGPGVTLADCLSAFFSADELKGDNMYSCEKCKKLRNGMKFCRLLQLPEVLCVHLKRFRHEYMTSYSSKISSTVMFPLKGLDLSRYVAPDCVSQVKTYDLSSVIVHQGGAGAGHYTAYCKSPLTGDWFEFDDQYVTQVTEATVANAEAYVLFYSKSNEDAKNFREQVLKLNSSPSQPVMMRFYVAVEWVVQFLTFAEPGAIDNNYFLCRHGDVKPAIFDEIGERVCCVSERVWFLLHERFGGGPAVTHLQACSTCIREEQLLEERRAKEHETYMKHNQSDEQRLSTFYISMAWFRKWQSFLQGDKEPPGEIDNNSITSMSADCQPQLRKSSDYGEVTADAWKFLHSQYGGGPVLPHVTPQLVNARYPEEMDTN